MKNVEAVVQLGGMTDTNGRWDRHVSSETVLLFDVQIDKDDLVWSWRDCIGSKDTTSGILRSFCRLEEASDSDVLNFARLWGPLALWMRAAHEVYRRPFSLSETADYLYQLSGSDRFGRKRYQIELPTVREPISVYRHIAKCFNAVLRIAAYVHRGEPGNQADWNVFGDVAPPFTSDLAPDRTTLDVARDYVSQYVNLWMSLGGVQFSLNWHSTSASGKPWEVLVEYGAFSSLGPLAFQLALMVSRSSGVYFCSGCSVPYFRSATRRPKPDEHNYCAECGSDQAKLDAKRRYRAAIRQALALRDNGLSSRQIAKQLGRPLDVIEKWLSKGVQ